MWLSRRRASAYVWAIVKGKGEAHDVAIARTGTRHHTLLKARAHFLSADQRW